MIDLEFTLRTRKPSMHLTHTYKFRKDIDVLFSLWFFCDFVISHYFVANGEKLQFLHDCCQLAEHKDLCQRNDANLHIFPLIGFYYRSFRVTLPCQQVFLTRTFSFNRSHISVLRLVANDWFSKKKN